MICDTCKYRKKKYCTYYKCKLSFISTNVDVCVAYREKKPYRKSTIKRDSLRQEKKASKSIGATLRPASGSLSNAKGDMSKGCYLISSKATRKDRITLKKEWLDEIRGQAIREGKCPVRWLDFGDHRSYVLAEEDFMEKAK